MAKSTVKIAGHRVIIDTSKKNVANAVAALIKACSEKRFSIGSPLMAHENGDEYLLCRIKSGSRYVAKLMNTRTGVARNSTKVVYVQDPTGGANGRGYVTDLPCTKDKFIDPENPGQYIETDEDGHVI